MNKKMHHFSNNFIFYDLFDIKKLPNKLLDENEYYNQYNMYMSKNFIGEPLNNIFPFTFLIDVSEQKICIMYNNKTYLLMIHTKQFKHDNIFFIKNIKYALFCNNDDNKDFKIILLNATIKNKNTLLF